LTTVFIDAFHDWLDALEGGPVESDRKHRETLREQLDKKERDKDIVQLLSNYFRTYVKHSDAVPAELDKLISGNPPFAVTSPPPPPTASYCLSCLICLDKLDGWRKLFVGVTCKAEGAKTIVKEEMTAGLSDRGSKRKASQQPPGKEQQQQPKKSRFLSFEQTYGT